MPVTTDLMLHNHCASGSIIQARIEQIQDLVKLETKGADETAHTRLLRAIDGLRLAVERPGETASRLNFQNLQNICLRIALEYDIYRKLAANDGKHMLASELARDCAIDELLLVRVMRVLTSIGLADETGPQQYTANDVTRFQSGNAAAGAMKHHYDLDMAMGGRLVDYMRGPGISQFAKPGSATEKSIFEYTFGVYNIFGLLEQHAEQKKSFDDYMAGRPRSKNWFEMYPAREKLLAGFKPDDASAVLFVDIGGGVGHETVRFKEAYPDLPGRLIVQDLPITIDKADALPHGIEAQRYDFFTPQPIRGARAYFLRNIMHNWSDDRCAHILSHVVDAMDADHSILLIDDYLVPDKGVPLRAAEMDILMFMHVSSLERTKKQWEALFERVGLVLTGVYPAGQGEESVLECRKVRE